MTDISVARLVLCTVVVSVSLLVVFVSTYAIQLNLYRGRCIYRRNPTAATAVRLDPMQYNYVPHMTTPQYGWDTDFYSPAKNSRKGHAVKFQNREHTFSELSLLLNIHKWYVSGFGDNIGTIEIWPKVEPRDECLSNY